MYLKTIEMQGFKSFADKTKIEFEKGVTAVVGPNGSGKSNITESLRWALGESSAKSLRGGKMPDIIFAGTESRNALNFAEVAIVLDNSDAFIKDAPKEIRVERHIYRNGDSDYIIDGKKVRLRDVHDLFMDTGLGRDSFSIISQGRVEEIFNSKPEERRTIFEEAAGVLKYKTRKKETQSKLTQTQDNLDRLEDIIFELDNQVKPLEKQAEIAKKFLHLDADRKQLQLDILVEDVQQDQKSMAEKEEDLGQLKENLRVYYEHRDSLEKENQSLKHLRQELVRQLDDHQATLLDLTNLSADLKRQIDRIQLETHQKNEKEAEAKVQLENLSQDWERLQEQIQEKRNTITSLESQHSSLSEEIDNLKNELQRYSNDPDQLIESLREEFVSLMQKEADYSNQLTLLISDMEKESQERASNAQEREEMLVKVQHLKADFQTVQSDYDVKQLAVRQLLEAYQKLEGQIAKQEVTYQAEQSQLFDLYDQKKAKEARLASLESIQKNHSQFYAGVKSVLQAAQTIGGILGAVSEHLSFDSQYQTALEIALGPSSQHIIVKDEVAAKSAISFLKQNRQGRATFLPLTTIKPRFLSDNQLHQVQQYQGFLGTAESLVSYDHRFKTIFQNLLNTTLIFDTVDHANLAAKALQYKVRIITLDGTELRPGGSFSGGSNRQNNTTFIKPEMDLIQKELSRLEGQLKEKETLVSDLKLVLKEEKEKLQDLKGKGEEARFAEQKAELHYQQLKETLADSEEILRLMIEQTDKSSLNDFETQKEELQNQLSQLETDKNQLSQQIDEIKGNKNLINEKKSELTNQLSQLQLKERDVTNQSRFEKTDLSRLESDAEACRLNIDKLSQLLQNPVSQEEMDRLPLLEKQLQDVESKKADVEQKRIQLRFKSEDCQAQLEDLEEQLSKEQAKNEDFIRQQTKLEAEMDYLKDRLRTFAKTLSEDFQMSFEEAKEMANPIQSMISEKQRLKQLLKTIKALGPINLDAISQFDEVSERLEFLNSQKFDLNKAKNLLLDTINSMDNEVKARFKVTFEAIRESFQETFKQMFGGGSADLVLTEGDLLSAGVEISVQPPGKKIQSLNLMSGGEKALSALALLFAIIRVKTIPFVILDEVEAALDEANVKRFGDYLNRFDKNSQFIVVTHRKGTMAAADSIYGITMQESGVSKVVSVKLKDSVDLAFLN